MIRKAVAVFVATTIGSSVMARAEQDYVGSFLPKYLNSDGSVDTNKAVDIAKGADCAVTKAYASVAKAKDNLAEENIRFQIYLYDYGLNDAALNEFQRRSEGAALDFAILQAKRFPHPAVQSAARTADAANKAIKLADWLVTYAKKKAYSSATASYINNIEFLKNSVVTQKDNLEESWKWRNYYREDLDQRGVKLPAYFENECVKGGGWKTVQSYLTQAGYAGEYWDGVDKSCEAVEAANADEYLEMVRREGKEDGGAGMGCKDFSFVVDEIGKISTQSTCPWADGWSRYNFTISKIDDNNVNISETYTVPGSQDSKIDRVLQSCDPS